MSKVSMSGRSHRYKLKRSTTIMMEQFGSSNVVRAPSPTGEVNNVSYLIRTSSGGHSCSTSISTGTCTSSVFSTEDDSYDARIKEIEEYYIKTLLNEDETPQEEYPNDEGFNDNSKAPIGYYQPLNDFKTSGFAQQAQQASFTGGASGVRLHFGRPKPKRNSLEVEINHNLRPADDLLPLTRENLQRLTINDVCQTRAGVRGEVQSGAHSYSDIHKTTQPAEQPQLNKELYKTELCESFTTKGCCRYGNKCQFAHGFHELKFKPKSNNYRTKPCVNWTKNGFCPYGKRCCFKHGNDEDIQIYAGHTNNIVKKNLHANVKALQKITW